MSDLIGVDIKVDTRDTERLLDALERALSGPSLHDWLMTRVDPMIRARAKARFMNEGDDVSGPWEALSPATVRIRQEKGFPGEHPINKRTGELERYITGRGTVTTTGDVADLFAPGGNPQGELVKKIETAQAGRQTPYTNPRKVLGINEADLLTTLVSLNGWLIEQVGSI
jgi:hypothetical protein